MGVTIQAESHTVELPAIMKMERDASVLEYYDQPEAIKLSYYASSQRKLGILHTPDFFVIRKDSIGWEEWKPENKLVELAKKMPARYVHDSTGWRCQPGEEYAAQFNFFYNLRSSNELNPIYFRNTVFLEDYFKSEQPPITENMRQRLLEIVCSQEGCTLRDLLDATDIDSRDALYFLIATGELYVYLEKVLLTEPERVAIFSAPQLSVLFESGREERLPLLSPARTLTPCVGLSITWDSQHWKIVNLGASCIALASQSGNYTELPRFQFETLVKEGKIISLSPENQAIKSAALAQILSRASPQDLEEANRRYASIKSVLDGTFRARDCSRTQRDWLRKFRDAEAIYGNGLSGLLPRRWAQGNRKRKLPEETLLLMEQFIDSKYETLTQKRKRSVWLLLLEECKKRAIIAPSYKSFVEEVNKRDRLQQTKKRMGRRASYQREPHKWQLGQGLPSHGDRPWEIGHIDHTEADIELLCSRTHKNLGRPWLTFLIDGCTRRILAFYLTFDPPSYRSAMMVLRECVKRHGRLPQIIVVDGGKEFQSVYFETLLARYEIVKKQRPPAKARFGSVCERLFGTTNTQLIHNLVGNTQIMKNVRQVTKSVNPKNLARWTLPALQKTLSEWAFEVYETTGHPALGRSPREAYDDGMRTGGERAHRLIPYDDEFQISTLPSTPRGSARIIPGNGVKIQHIYYWAEAFRDPELERRRVYVRYDPFNIAIAYAYIKNAWVSCVSQYEAALRGRSEREIRLATEELRRQSRLHGQQLKVTAPMLAKFLSSTEAHEKLLDQRLKDSELKETLEGREGRSQLRLVTNSDRSNDAEPTLNQATSIQDDIDPNDIEEF